MPRFFVDQPVIDFFELLGDNAYHIMKSLRMKIGETLTLCSDNIDYICEIIEFKKTSVIVRLLNVKTCTAEPDIKITLFQGIPKGEKMDFIIQKAVEVGVCKIVPVLMNRCVSRPDEKSLNKKIIRWQKIALEAAKQSGRGIIPDIMNAMNFDDAINFANSNNDKMIAFYEGGGMPIYKLIDNKVKSAAIFIGPEGGFESFEIENITKSGANVASLGTRILRTETAAIIASSMIIYESEREV